MLPFISCFYDHYLHWLVYPFPPEGVGDPGPDGVRERPDLLQRVPAAALKATKALVVDLLSFCVREHAFRIKYYTLRENLCARILPLLHYRERYLHRGACISPRFSAVWGAC